MGDPQRLNDTEQLEVLGLVEAASTDPAARAGCATAFVARPGKVRDPLVERPEIIGADLAEVAEAILVIDHGDERP